MASLLRSARVRLLGLTTVGAVLLAGCSGAGGSAGELTAAPAVTANGHHYVYAPGTVAKSDWPKVCSLLTSDSAAAAIGTAVTTKAFHQRCYYIPVNDAFPTVTVTILGIGSDQQNAYDAVRDTNDRYHPRAVDGVGKAAITYPLPASPTVNLDMLADQGLFEIALRSPVGNKAGAAEAQTILGKIGRALAAEFAR